MNTIKLNDQVVCACINDQFVDTKTLAYTMTCTTGDIITIDGVGINIKSKMSDFLRKLGLIEEGGMTFTVHTPGVYHISASFNTNKTTATCQQAGVGGYTLKESSN